MTLTPRQFAVSRAIRNHHILRGRCPTLQAVADELGKGKVTVWEIVRRLKEKGIVRHERYSQHGLALVDGVKLPDERRSSCFPYLGEIV